MVYRPLIEISLVDFQRSTVDISIPLVPYLARQATQRVGREFECSMPNKGGSVKENLAELKHDKPVMMGDRART
jgi:hypothetical protein